MRLAWKFAIILCIVLILSIVPNILLIRSEVIPWFSLEMWTVISVARFLLLFAILFTGLYVWVIKPLHLIRRSLMQNDPSIAAQIAGRSDETGTLSRLVQEFLDQQNTMKSLVQEKNITLERQRELIRLKSEFISLVSHEFRTPLTAISSNIQLLERYENTWSPEKRAEVIHRVRNAIGKLVLLLEEVSLMAKDPERTWSPNTGTDENTFTGSTKEKTDE